MNTTPHRRKVMLIDPQFQKSFLSYMLGMTGIVIVIFYSTTRIFFWKIESQLNSLNLPPGHLFYRMLSDQKNLMNGIFALTAIVVCGVMLWYGLYLSNRVAGPIYRLKLFLRQDLAKNPGARLSFRKGDYFRELADAINEHVEQSGVKRTTE